MHNTGIATFAVLAIIFNIATVIWAAFGIVGIINGEYTFINIFPTVLLAHTIINTIFTKEK